MIEILSKKESAELREIFIRTFANTDSPEFEKGIKRMISFSDGEFYTACLWDFLRSPTQISSTECLECVRNKVSPFYVMFDLHSSDNIPAIKDCGYDNKRIVKMTFSDFEKELENFADDPYIFDETLEEAVVFTHEYSDKGRQYCLKTNG